MSESELSRRSLSEVAAFPRPLWKRAPLVTGVAGGVGVSTVVAALGGREWPRDLPDPVGVVVCRATVDSLLRARGCVRRVTGPPPLRRAPVLAVVWGESDPPPPVLAHLDFLQELVTDIVRVPFVPSWREIEAPLGEAQALAGCAPDRVPAHLRSQAVAMRDIDTALDVREPARLPPVRHAPARPLRRDPNDRRGPSSSP